VVTVVLNIVYVVLSRQMWQRMWRTALSTCPTADRAEAPAPVTDLAHAACRPNDRVAHELTAQCAAFLEAARVIRASPRYSRSDDVIVQELARLRTAVAWIELAWPTLVDGGSVGVAAEALEKLARTDAALPDPLKRAQREVDSAYPPALQAIRERIHGTGLLP
jgi:hypothetical protein